MRETLNYYLFYIFSIISISAHSTNFKHIGIAEGLSQLSVMSIHQDQLGRMWFGTEEGLNMYDGQRMKIFKPRYKIDAHSVEGKDGVLGNNNYPITEDKAGNLFFCSDAALIKFDLLSQKFHVVLKENVSTVVSHQGEIWFAVKDSIFKIHNDTISFVLQAPRQIQITCLHIQQNDIWIGSNFGLYIANTNKEFDIFIPTTTILSIFEDSRQNLWIATLREGAYKIDKKRSVTRYTHKRNNPNSISSNLVRCFTEDNSGKIWIGTFKGLNRLDTVTGKFTLYTSGEKHKLSHSSVFSLCKDHQGNMWVGTYYGGVNYFSPENNIFSYYSENELNYPFIGSMVEDSDNHLWICTEGGGLTCFDRSKNAFQHFQISWQKNGNTIHHNNLKTICYDSISQRLFIGTHTGGLSCYDLKKQRFKHYYSESAQYASMLGPVVDKLAIYKNLLIIQVRGGIFTMDLQTEKFAPLFNDTRYDHYWVHTFTVDSKGYIWIASNTLLSCINLNNPSDKQHFPLGQKGLGQFSITRIIEAPGNEIYIGTRGSGLCKYERSTQSFRNYTQRNNMLLSDYCYDIAISPKGSLIITGNRGITLFNPQKNKSKFIGLENSVPISAINVGCKVYVCKDGEIFVGGVDGLMSFKEEAINIKQPESHLYFSTLWINNQEVYPGDENHVLNQTLPVVADIDLKHNQNNISLDFASTNYITTTQSGIYEYRLEGLEEQWHTTNHCNISYTNLPIGTYKLLVREKNAKSSGYIPQEANLVIQVHPAFYHTNWAYLLYTLLTLYILFCFIRFYYSRMKLRAAVEFERAGKERIQELNQAKINFFTTVSHEFRTPLTLIISQMELLMQGTPLPPNVYNRIAKVYKNALSMKELISELLTFQKQEQSMMSLKVEEIRLYPFLKEIYQSFSDYANTCDITYELTCHSPEVTCWADKKQLRKVFNNLLSNAFKYTDKQGKIEIVIAEEEGNIVIQIIDSGLGIPLKDQEHIFDLFYQVSNKKMELPSQTGSGVGLALVKRIIDSHHGNVCVFSQPGYGSIFTVTLKNGKDHLLNDRHVDFTKGKVEETISIPNVPDLFQETETIPTSAEEKKTHTILIAEDNEEMLQILNNLFAPIYQVLLAQNGKEALAITMKQKPDIILSDVMMPEMSGKQLCTAIKNSFDLCHIPVVLLTALDSDEEKLDGLAQRADDYISKPFNARQLIVRCNNLVYNRKQLQKKFSKEKSNDASHILATNPLDKKFLRQVDEIIAANLDKEEFDINQLIQEIGISRSSFYAKFKALSGISPNEYLINCRLKHAAHLLRTRPDLQITEISWQVGFGSPRYFTKCFKAMYLISPMEYRKSVTNENET